MESSYVRSRNLRFDLETHPQRMQQQQQPQQRTPGGERRLPWVKRKQQVTSFDFPSIEPVAGRCQTVPLMAGKQSRVKTGKAIKTVEDVGEKFQKFFYFVAALIL